MPQCIEYILEGTFSGTAGDPMKLVIPVSSIGMIAQLTTLIDSLLPEAKIKIEDNVIESIYIFCLIWSLGAPLVDEGRQKLSDGIKKLSELPLVHNEAPVLLGQLPGADKSLFEYMVDVEGEKWVSWEAHVPEYEHNHAGSFHDILVPTMETVCHTFLLGISQSI